MLNFSAEIDFYPSYALVKERFRRVSSSDNLWSWTESNRRLLACKASALPTELQPQTFVVGIHLPAVLASPSATPLGGLVGLGGLEPPTSRLSGARSSQLSYRPSGFPSQRPILSKNRALARPLKTRQQALDSIAETLTWSTSATEVAGTPCGAEALTVYPVSLERR